MKTKLFIGSSVKGLEIARAIQENLFNEFESVIWDQGVFDLTYSSLDSLFKVLDNFDLACFVFLPEDHLEINGVSNNSVRDNVIFELGLFLGRFGRERVSFAVPLNYQGLHLPTDLLGITYGSFEYPSSNIVSSVGRFCNQMRRQATDNLTIDFPERGKYGLNLLCRNNHNFFKEASFKAIIPRGKLLTMKLSKKEGVEDMGGWSFSVGNIEDWVITRYDNQRNEQFVKAQGKTSTDLHFIFNGRGQGSMAFYENDSPEPFLSKEFSWNAN